MKLRFDSKQDYQLEAVKSVIKVFEGQPLSKGDYEVSFSMEGASIAFTEKGIGNNLVLNEEQLISNINSVQEANDIEQSEELKAALAKDGTVHTGLNLTVEMETGTGKTYTYIRTIYELNKVYGFKKFVIVVPSVAIREGVIKNLKITNEHFQGLYDNPPLDFKMYDRKDITALRSFAVANAIQVLVINIDSFTKDSNVINTKKETGIKPIEYLQSTKPIVIIDEPQNMETDIRKQAIQNLNPMCTIRYSATHKNLYNLLYSLNPIQAYDLGLVKQIEVDGITTDDNYNAAYIEFVGIQKGKKTIKAKLKIYVNDKNGVKSKEVNVEAGSDLYELSNQREIYKNNFIVDELSTADGYVKFDNGVVISEGQSQGGLSDEVMKYQIERTVKWHLDKVRKYQPQGIKVLSLFFIDKVANYRTYSEDGGTQKGKFAVWFEEAYNKLIQNSLYKDVLPFSAEEVHNGYFSQDKKGKLKDSREGRSTKDDEDTYSLIMQEKERLLSLDVPLQFIFSHSALREGWDNPNVFQICTLNETRSEIKKRQEIGRGLRLPVNKDGQRVFDKNINVLTVIANETYEDFSKELQTEIEKDTSVSFKGKVKNARDKKQIKRNKELTIENYPLLFEIWQKISQKTKYSVAYSTEELIKQTVEELQDFDKVPKTKPLRLDARKGRLTYTEDGIESEIVNSGGRDIEEAKFQIPDVYGYIQSRLDITRKTIYEILIQSERYSELQINPQMFLDNVIAAIKRTLNKLLVDGIKYEKINGEFYEMSLFKSEEIETYLSNLFEVRDYDKTIFNYVPIESDVESDFARDCEVDESVKFYFKLPRAFKIPTPIDSYRPDWAVIFEGDKRIYFVAETKSTDDWQKLRVVENMKIECGKRHFALFEPDGVKYKKVIKVRDLH